MGFVAFNRGVAFPTGVTAEGLGVGVGELVFLQVAQLVEPFPTAGTLVSPLPSNHIKRLRLPCQQRLPGNGTHLVCSTRRLHGNCLRGNGSGTTRGRLAGALHIGLGGAPVVLAVRRLAGPGAPVPEQAVDSAGLQS